MSTLAILPLLIPLIATGLMVALFRQPALHRPIALLTLTAHLFASLTLLEVVWRDGVQVMAVGTWAAPFGIVIAVDVLGAGLASVTGLVGLATLIFAGADIDEARTKVGFYPLYTGLITGVTGAFTTGDIFNLYVWFEVLLIASFGLIVLGGTKRQLDGAVKYAILNLLATTLFLIGTGMLYGVTGTLNMADLAGKVAAAPPEAPLSAIAALYLIAFSMKGAAFPLFFWLPSSYHTPDITVSGIFAGLLTKVGVYALIRTFTLIFPDTHPTIFWVMLAIAGSTMIIGALGAIAQNDFRRLFGFILIAGIGYMLMGLGLENEQALTGAIYYALHSIVITTALFLTVGVIRNMTGAESLSGAAGIYGVSPLFATVFFIIMLSTAGLPPFTGFWGKALLIRGGVDAGAPWITGALLISAFLCLLALGKVWALAFWRKGSDLVTVPTGERHATMVGPIVALMLFTAVMGLWPGPMAGLAVRASAELTDPSGYIEAVLNADVVRPGQEEK
ncbi:MAG: Na+/H+ antiporter subunit D [Pseudomonadota bacterium]